MSSDTILKNLRSYAREDIARPMLANSPNLGGQLDLLQQNLSLSRAEVIRCRKPELGERLNRVLNENNIKRLCHGREPAMQSLVDGLPETVEPVCYSQAIEGFREELFSDIDAGLTGCDAALAESGTLVLSSSVERPRLLSLVPPVHIAIVMAEQLHYCMGDWLRAVDKTTMPSNYILISGPSKSADIEQVLAYGVHGPKSLVVLLVEPQ